MPVLIETSEDEGQWSSPATIANVPGLIESAALQLRVAKRLAPRRGATFGQRFGRLDDRFVFVVGSPRSGTTFLAGAVGSLPGFVDLGEVAPLKAAVPELARLGPEDAARRMRRILGLARRVGLVGTVRAVEQTPELAHVVRIIPLAYPNARIVHIVRDGRDVACSLLDKPWLRSAQVKSDDAGLAYGSYARFWVEPDRREEFETATDARRAAWVWRRYVSAVRSAQNALEVRYEHLARAPELVAAELGRHLDVPAEPLIARLRRAHEGSVGRFRRDLDEAQLAEIMDEAGQLLRELDYVSSASA